MTLIPDTRSINLYIGIPYREKFLIYDTDGSLFSFGTGTFTGYIGSLRITQANGMIEYNKQEGEIVIDISEPSMLTLSAGATTYSITFTDFQGQETVVAGGTATVYARSSVVGGGSDPWTAPIKIGTVSNYTEIEADGTIRSAGEATIYNDMLGPLIGRALNNPGGRITQNYVEGSVDFDDNTTLSDYAIMVLQLNHGWVLGTDIAPHVHWWQTGSAVPNWLVQYRWQRNGEAKTTAWTYTTPDNHVYTYVSGTLCQITGFVDITPPADYGLSDIIQLRLLRDTANASGLFAGTDPVTGTVASVNFDCHVQLDMGGSRNYYAK